MNNSSISESDRKDDLEETDTSAAEASVSEGEKEPVGLADAIDGELERDRVEDAVLEDEHHETGDDPHGSGFAAAALKFLILVLVVFGLSLWLVPMLAPHLPATIARHLMPGQHAVDQRIAAIEETVASQTGASGVDIAAMKASIAELTERLATSEAAAQAAVAEATKASEAAAQSAASAQSSATSEDVLTSAETAVREASEMARTATTAATEAGKVASAATRDTASLARQMISFEARMAGLSDEISAMTETLASTAGQSGEAVSSELSAAFAALKVRVDALGEQTANGLLTTEDADRFATQDDLRSARTALEAQAAATIATFPPTDAIVTTDVLDEVRSDLASEISGLGERITGAEETVKAASDAAMAAEEAASTAVDKVDGAIKLASMRSAIAAMTSRMDAGASFASALAELEELSGELAPSALGRAAQSGVATPAALLRSIGRPAQQALAAEIKATSGDDILSQASAKLRSVVAGRPKSEQQGDDAAAILSRAEARLRDGLAPEALAEIETLPNVPKEALGEWLERLRARAEAETARTQFLSQITGSQG